MFQINKIFKKLKLIFKKVKGINPKSIVRKIQALSPKQMLRAAASSKLVRFILKDKKHIVASACCAAVIIVGVITLIVYLLRPQTLDQPGFCLVGDNVAKSVCNVKTGVAKSVQIQNFGTGSRISKSGSAYDIRSADGESFKIADGFPVFTNQGAYLYIYSSRFLLVDTDFKTEKSSARTYIGGGKVYNASHEEAGKSTILFVRLPNGLFVNTQALTVETTSQTVSIPVNSVIYMNKNYFSCLQIKNGKCEILRMPMAEGIATISFDGKTFSCNDILGKVGAAQKSSSTARQFSETLYQYYMGQRYEYTGEKTFYPYDHGFFLSWDKKLSVLSTQPLYSEKNKKLVLPSDYVLVQPQFSAMYKLPAMSEVFSDKLATYTKSESRVNTYTMFFLFNGNDTYIFPTGAELDTGEKKPTVLEPYSSVVMCKNGTIGIYRYGSQYSVKKLTSKVTAKFGNKSTLLLNDSTVYFSSGQKMMLFQKPSLLQEDSQKLK